MNAFERVRSFRKEFNNKKNLFQAILVFQFEVITAVFSKSSRCRHTIEFVVSLRSLAKKKLFQ